MGAPSPEVNKDVVEDSFLQGRHIGVHILRLTAHIFVRVVRDKFVHHGVRQGAEDQSLREVWEGATRVQ